jgi:predicted ester cyclase
MRRGVTAKAFVKTDGADESEIRGIAPKGRRNFAGNIIKDMVNGRTGKVSTERAAKTF